MQAKLDEIWMAALTFGIAVAAGYGWLSTGEAGRSPAVATTVVPAAITPAAAEEVVLESTASGEPTPVYRLPAIVVTGKRAQMEDSPMPDSQRPDSQRPDRKTTSNLAGSVPAASISRQGQMSDLVAADRAGRSEQRKPVTAHASSMPQAAVHPIGWSCTPADQSSHL